MSIPLVQKPEKDDINTSIIAIKRNIERINMLLGLVDSGSPDLSGFVKKSDIVDVVESGNNNPVSSNAVAGALGGKVNFLNFNALTGMTLTQIFNTYASQNTATYVGYIDWSDSRAPEANTCFVFAGDWQMLATTVYGVSYYFNSGTSAWVKSSSIVISRTFCTPLGVSALFNNDGIDCLTDCKYINGMHHVCGLIYFNPSRESNGFQISATPSKVIDVGNLIWVNGTTNFGTSVICRVINNTVLWWNGDQISTNNVIVNFDFWYKEA